MIFKKKQVVEDKQTELETVSECAPTDACETPAESTIPESWIWVEGYKGFRDDLTCNGFQYEVGRAYAHDGDVEACKSGFHMCLNLYDVMQYYGWNWSNKFCKVRALVRESDYKQYGRPRFDGIYYVETVNKLAAKEIEIVEDVKWTEAANLVITKNGYYIENEEDLPNIKSYDNYIMDLFAKALAPKTSEFFALALSRKFAKLDTQKKIDKYLFVRGALEIEAPLDFRIMMILDEFAR